MVKRILVLICCVTLYIIGVSAQATKKVTGAYTYHAPENISLEEAKHIAVNRAKIAAISDTFGTLVTQNNSTMISNKNGQSDNWFFSIGSSEIKGEWIETTKEPTFDISYQQGNLTKVQLSSIEETLKHFGLLVRVSGQNPDDVLRTTKLDKKMVGNQIKFILLKTPGDAYIEKNLTDEQILEGILYIYGEEN